MPTSGNATSSRAASLGRLSSRSARCFTAMRRSASCSRRFNLLARTSALRKCRAAAAFIRSGGPRGSGARRHMACLDRSGLPTGGPPAVELSGGQQQRVAIARALVNEPADPPGGRADRRARQQTDPGDHPPVRGAERDPGITVVLVTHEPDIAARVRARIIRSTTARGCHAIERSQWNPTRYPGPSRHRR